MPNKKIFQLATAGFLLLVIAYLAFPWIAFVAFVPLLWMQQDYRRTIFPLIAVLGLTFAIIQLTGHTGPSVAEAFGYGLFISLPFSLYALSNRIIPNKLGLLTFIIYFAGCEYIAVKVAPGFSHLLLGSVLADYPSVQYWNPTTGITGVTGWILLGNVLFAQAFSPEKLSSKAGKGILAVYILIVLSLPALISFFLMEPRAIILPETLIAELGNDIDAMDPVEKFGRTCAWVSGFILIYALVKYRIKKK